MFEWVWCADEEAPRWLRGENPRSRPGGWLDLDNLLVGTKLDARCEAAALWFVRERVGPHVDAGLDGVCEALGWPADDVLPLWELAQGTAADDAPSLSDVVARLRGAPVQGRSIRRRATT